jgi:hypothetical protein
MNKLFLFLAVILSSLSASAIRPAGQSFARITILTCTPGPDLYSVFGHTAIRVEDNFGGEQIDWVYNYGTFEFSDDFYWKFAQGKLDYKLSKSDFGFFQEEYIYTGRGIYEQELMLSPEDKFKLIELLEENYKPENRVYRYDFFYDNCSSRVRDIIVKAAGKPTSFSYVYARPYTFRQAIQNYLNYMPWSDFGIDLALGMPCDRLMDKGQAMFLPDSLLNEFNYATYGEGPIAAKSQELLPYEFELSDSTVFTPMVVFGLFLIVQMIWGFVRLRSGRSVAITDRVLLFTTGLVGVMVVFLWFFTDHNATKWNLNILWANPLMLYLAFARMDKKWIKTYWKIQGGICVLLVVGWFFLPQRLHLATLPMVLGLLFISLRQVRPQFFVSNRGKQGRAVA